MKLTCPNCKREHTLREPYPAPSSRIQCTCGRRLAVQYPPGMVEQLRRRGARFEGDAPAGGDPFQAIELKHGGTWKASAEEEATSIFSPDQIEAAAQRTRSKQSLIPEAPPVAPRLPDAPPPRADQPPPRMPRAAPDLRRVPDHAPTTMFPFSEPPPNRPAPPAAEPGFEEEPTALFLSDGKVERTDLRQIPDHGRTGLIYPVGRAEPAPPPRGPSPVGVASAASTSAAPPPRAPTPESPVGRASPAGLELPVAPAVARPEPRPAPIVVERPVPIAARAEAPVSPVISMDLAPVAVVAASLEPVAASQPSTADQAFPETASGVRRGATLDEIMRLKVEATAPATSFTASLPRLALGLLLLLALCAVVAVAAGAITLVLRR